LRAAPSLLHVRHIQQRWRLPSRRHQVSPSKTAGILKEEHEWLDTYSQARNQVSGSGETAATKVQEAASRIAALEDVLRLQAHRKEVEGQALTQYVRELPHS
jgi:hypothetical protein